jgi:hypothetical protein
MMEFEKRGVPTVSFTADTFVRDARRSAESFGFGGLPLAVVPLPFTNQPPDAVCGAVDECIDKVVAGLTKKVLPAQVRHEIAVVADEWLAIKGESELEALEEMNRLFLEYGWGDGFPLRAPDERSIAQMLKGTTRAADEIVAILEPGFGKATVEKIAVNALMAGCRPEHLPVVIAAVECLAEPQMYIRNKAMSTGPHAPLIWVNGPLAKRAGINAGICALGPGAPSYANSVIGRAVRLCMMNIGLTYAGVSDMDTIGSPTKYSMCVAENQQASPWTPYHVDHGYKPDASTVTVHFVYGICELHDFTNYEPARLVDVFATAATNAAQLSTGLWLIGRRADPRYGTEEKEHHTMFICPEHADNFRKAGWNKAEIRKAMYAKARMRFDTLMLAKERKAMEAAHPELQWLWDSPETMLPVVEDPDCYEIVVVGGAAGRGAFFWGAGEPQTKEITDVGGDA